MHILFKCECGSPGMVPDDAAGQTFTCQSCGRSGIVPQQSSDECVLVFKDGFPLEGMPYDKADFLAKLSERFFTGHDLVSIGGSWLPISVVYEVPPAPAPPPPNGLEIATAFSELPPIPGVYSENLKMSGKRGANIAKILLRVVLPVALVLCVVLYFIVFKPLMKRAGWHVSYVNVFNPDSESYTAELGGVTNSLLPHNNTTFSDCLPWFSGSRTLTIKGNGQNVVYSVKVPLLPDYDVVVSPGGKLKFDTFEQASESFKSNSVNAAPLVAELSANAEPKSLHSIAGTLYDIGIKRHINTLDNEIYSSAQYSFSNIGLKRSDKYMEKRKSANLEKAGKPELVIGKLKMEIQNASFDFSVHDKNGDYTLKLPQDLKLPAKSVCDAVAKCQADKGVSEDALIAVNPSAKADAISVRFDERNGKMLATMEFHGEVASRHHKYTGTWKYNATMLLSGADSGKWSWEWRFNGKLVTKYSGATQPPIEIIYARAVDGTEKSDVKVGAR